MKATYNWLKSFVEIKIPPEKLAEKLTIAGIEVKSIEEKSGDSVFEIEITSNRPDWLSISGIAREVAALTGAKIKTTGQKSKVNHKKSKNKYPLKIEIRDKKDCSLYTGAVIKNVKVGASPEWLVKRLELLGVRSVNNIVDITNYILFEWGQPLHAFDLDKVSSGHIVVRRPGGKEEISTIDGEKRAVDNDNLLIADSQKPLAVAGVMGGIDSEVSYQTKDILLEAAIFDPVLIRRSRQKLGMQSESSYRFERGVDADTLAVARSRAIEMILEIAGGELVALEASGASKVKKKIITLELSSVARILGLRLPQAKIKGILGGLGFIVRSSKKKGVYLVERPGFRQDIEQEADLIEELARIWGYDLIPTTLPRVTPQPSVESSRGGISLLKNILVGSGLNEVITYSLIDRLSLENFGIEDTLCIDVENPLSKEQEVLRPSLLPSLLKCVSSNLRQKQGYINIFEVAKIFSRRENSPPKESLALGICLCGTKSWLSESGRVNQEAGLLDLKGVIEALFIRLGIESYRFRQKSGGRTDIYLKRDLPVGVIVAFPKPLLEKFEIKNKEVVGTQLLLEEIFKERNLKKKFRSLPIYPGISRDISIILKEEFSAGDLLREIRQKAGFLLEDVRITDFYRGKQIPDGFKGLTISCFYRSRQRTLSDEEVSPVHTQVSENLVEKFQVKFR